MADTRGTWSLSETWAEKSAAEWVAINDVFLTPSETRVDTCYWVAGHYSGNSDNSRCDKTNIASNTTTQIPALNSAMNGGWRGGFSSALAGYAAGRHPGPSTGQGSDIDKVTYATDTNESDIANLSAARGYIPVGTNNNTHGYTLGGAESGSPWAVDVSKVDRFTFASDSAELLPGTQLLGTRKNGTTSSNTEKGYVAGGQPITPRGTTIEKISYNTDTITSIPSTLPVNQRRASGSTNGDGTIGYYIGGSTSPGMNYLSSCTKHVYSTDTISDVSSGRIYTPRGVCQGAGNTTYALTAGGYYYNSSSGGTHYSSVDRMSYSNESSSRQPSLNMSQNRKRGVGFGARTYARGTTYDGSAIRWKDNAAQSANYGIFNGGNGPSGGSAIDKLDFETETISPATNIGGSENLRNCTYGSSDTKAYINMGRNPAWPWSQGVSFCWKFSYASSTLVGSYTPYFGNRGYNGTGLDSKTATTITNLAGEAQGANTTFRVTHSTDATSTVPGLVDSNNTRASSAGVSNISEEVAYYSGGTSPNTSYTNKITFASDTRALLPGANYPTNIYGHSAVGGPTTGYFSQGYSPGSPTYKSQVYKFTYSTESFSALSGTMSGSPGGSEDRGSTGNQTQGYFFGGQSYAHSNVDKVTYATDTLSILSGKMPANNPSPYTRGISAGAISVRQNNRSGIIQAPDATPTGSFSPFPLPTPDIGYFSGGMNASNVGYPSQPPTSNQFSGTDKITMASETVALAPGANLTTAKYFPVAMSSVTDAYVAGGWNNPSTPNPSSAPGALGGSIQTIDKISYTTDTASRLGNLNFSSGSLWNGGGNNVKGYFAGGAGAGSGGSYPSRADKITFATDSIQGLSIPGFGRRQGDVGVYENDDAYGGGGIYFGRGEYSKSNGGYNHTTVRVLRTSTETGLDVPSMNTGLPFAYAQSWSNPTHWMMFGGWTGPAYSVSPGIRSTACKVTWATETDAELPSSTGENLSGAGSAGNNTYGYAGGGRTTSPGDNRSYVLRYTFESDTFAFRPSSNLTGDRKFLAGTSAKEHANPQPSYNESRRNVI